METKSDLEKTLKQTLNLYNEVGSLRVLSIQAEKDSNYSGMRDLLEQGLNKIDTFLSSADNLKPAESKYLKILRKEYLGEISKFNYPQGKMDLNTPITQIGLDTLKTNILFKALNKKDGRRISRYLGEAIQLKDEDIREPGKAGDVVIGGISDKFESLGYKLGMDFHFIRPDGD